LSTATTSPKCLSSERIDRIVFILPGGDDKDQPRARIAAE